MKTRQSGMPTEEMWQNFFNPTGTLQALGLRHEMTSVVDFGCGYGTFTIPAGQLITGFVHACDIERDMIEETRRRAEHAGLKNIKLHLRDFITDGTGLPDATVDYAMLFNILHAEHPSHLLAEAFRILRNGGILGIMHWNHDARTPRGPSMDIRPKPEQCSSWAEEVGFTIIMPHVDLPPYHYGIVAEKVNEKRQKVGQLGNGCLSKRTEPQARKPLRVRRSQPPGSEMTESEASELHSGTGE